MSIALICDRCGNTFPEGEDGSFNGSGNVNARSERGRQYTETKRVDICGVCNAGNINVGKKPVEITQGT